MNIFVGAEYVIANALIELSKKGQAYITFDRLRNLGWEIQQLCNQEGINAIIMTSGSRIKDAIYDFSDYFEYIAAAEECTEPRIRVKKDCPITDLEDRFIYCLPFNIVKVIQSSVAKLVA